MSGKTIKKILSALLIVKSCFLRCFLILPLAYIVPKRKNLVVFLGHSGLFVDNSKHLFLYVHTVIKRPVDHYFLIEDKQWFERLKNEGLPVIFHPSARSMLTLLRAKVAVVDRHSWVYDFKYHFMFGSRKVQLWHGVGFKKIERDMPESIEYLKTIRGKIYWWLTSRFPKYELLVSTSEFYTKNVFSTGIKYKKCIEAGYPRNDSMFAEPDRLMLLSADVKSIEKIEAAKQAGHRIVIYAPTFRKNNEENFLSAGTLDLERLSAFGREKKMTFVLKAHINTQLQTKIGELPNVIHYDNGSDVYPALRLTDAMITDYSSIYMDYLLLDRPLIFFPYDYEKYVKENGQPQFDYDWITPGPKCLNQAELEREMSEILEKGKDGYAKRRREILNVAFKHKDGRSSERIWSFISEKYL